MGWGGAALAGDGASPEMMGENRSTTGEGLPVGVVLAGGASRRMGRDKALLPWDGLPLAEHAARRLAAVCAEVLLADGGRGLIPAWPSVPDGPGAGPAAGILGAAAQRPGRALLVLACDLPAVPVPLLRALAEAAAPPAAGEPAADWVVPRHGGRLEPLCACYRPPALAALAAQVATGELALHRLAQRSGLAAAYLEGAALTAFGEPSQLFANLNRPADLNRLRPP
jgi:molybdopterin-guanine dinucleotide biosynthesis protein A